jgi:enamine deaminase RidA (YjgF/YER057c/UK114 family)
MKVERFLPRKRASYRQTTDTPGSFADALRAGERIYLSAQSGADPDGNIAAPGDAAAQTNAALDRLEAALIAAGGSLEDITKLTTSIVDRGHRKDVYGAISRRLPNVYPVSTGLVVAGLPAPALMVQIDAEAVSPAAGATGVQRYRKYDYPDWHGQNFAWQGCMVAAGTTELFVRGQTGSTLDGKGTVGRGRRPEDAAAQADLALSNLTALLNEAGSSLDDVAKITVYISDRAYRTAVYPMIGKHFRGIHPVSTGIIVQAFARPEILFEIDVHAFPKTAGQPRMRLRKYQSKNARYGTEQQPLDCDFCMTVREGNRVILRGQTGMALNEVLKGPGDVVAQAEQAMDNVAVLLGEAGAKRSDIVKATVFVTDRAFLAAACDVILGRLSGVNPAFSALIVKGLASPELLMEVDITAVIEDGPA